MKRQSKRKVPFSALFSVHTILTRWEKETEKSTIFRIISFVRYLASAFSFSINRQKSSEAEDPPAWVTRSWFFYGLRERSDYTVHSYKHILPVALDLIYLFVFVSGTCCFHQFAVLVVSHLYPCILLTVQNHVYIHIFYPFNT